MPVGGAIIAGFDHKIVAEVSQTYPGLYFCKDTIPARGSRILNVRILFQPRVVGF